MPFKAFVFAIAVVVLLLMGIGAHRVIFNSDSSGKPNKAQLWNEFLLLKPNMSKESLRYIDKINYVYLIGIRDTSKAPIFAVDPVTAGWSLRSRRQYAGGKVIRYCRGRLSLSIDSNTEAAMTDFGIYWSSDRGSSVYCSQKRD